MDVVASDSDRDRYRGMRLRQIRVDAGLSREDLSRLTAIKVERLGRAEAGNLARWLSAEEINRIATAAGVEPHHLM